MKNYTGWARITFEVAGKERNAEFLEPPVEAEIVKDFLVVTDSEKRMMFPLQRVVNVILKDKRPV
jgi:hypothetical protein